MALPSAVPCARVALVVAACGLLGAPAALAAEPETQITSGPPATATTPEEATRPFVFSSPSPSATFECRLDAAAFSTCQSPQSFPGVPSDGPHTFEVRDNQGPDQTPAMRSFTVAIPPETSFDGFTTEAEGTVVLLRFSSDDPTATYECAVDSGGFAPCSSPFRAAGLAAGSHAFRVRGSDRAQPANVDPTPATAQFFVAAPRPSPPPPFFAPPPPFMSSFPPRDVRPRPVTSGFQVVGDPSGSAGTITVSVATRLAGTLKISAAVKGAPDRPFARAERRLEPTASGRSRGSGGQAIKLPLDRATRAQVKRSVRLSAVLTLTFTAPTLDKPVVVTTKLTLLAKPTFRRSGGGVTRPGGFGVERLRGTRGGDVLGGQSGNDRLSGLGGNDRLVGGTGNDTLKGGGGDDSLDGSDGDDRSFGGPGDDLIIEERFGDDTISGGPGNDWIVGGRGIDRISGGAGDDVIFGGSAPDTVDCGPGDDIVFVNLQSERRMVRGCEEILQEGNVVSRPCSAGGTDGPETLLGTDGSDTCRGGGGADDLEGAGGDDQLFGGDGDDRMFGRFGNDRMFGGAGNDELEGGRGADVLDGGAGSDQLNGGLGNDTIRGGPGNDRVIARSGGRDRVNCGPGRDTAVGDRRDTFKNCERVRRA